MTSRAWVRAEPAFLLPPPGRLGALVLFDFKISWQRMGHGFTDGTHGLDGRQAMDQGTASRLVRYRRGQRHERVKGTESSDDTTFYLKIMNINEITEHHLPRLVRILPSGLQCLSDLSSRSQMHGYLIFIFILSILCMHACIPCPCRPFLASPINHTLPSSMCLTSILHASMPSKTSSLASPSRLRPTAPPRAHPLFLKSTTFSRVDSC